MMTGTSSAFDLGFRCYLDGQSQHFSIHCRGQQHDWRPNKRRKPCWLLYKTSDMETINLALATINHHKERQEQRAISELWETLGWQVKEASWSTERGRRGKSQNMKSLNDLDKSLDQMPLPPPAPVATTNIASRNGQMSPEGTRGWEPWSVWTALPGVVQGSGFYWKSLVVFSALCLSRQTT